MSDSIENWEVIIGDDPEKIKSAIASARASGSIGFRDVEIDSSGKEMVVVEVVQLNSDGSRRLPYTKAY